MLPAALLWAACGAALLGPVCRSIVVTGHTRGDPFDSPLMVSLSNYERLAQDVLVEPRAGHSPFDKLRASDRTSGPTHYHPEFAAQTTEIISAIQIHGNTATTDDEIRRLAQIDVGARVEATTVDDVAARLRATKRFQSVQVLKRFASIADPSQIVLVIVVDEGPVKIEVTGDPDHPTRVVRSRNLNLMFLPVLVFEDGYGFTYGVRFAKPDVAGKGSRVSFPLTWGGDKRAGVEFDAPVRHGPIDRMLAGASVSRRENPFYAEDDDRQRAWVRGEREIVRNVRVGATGGWQRASFFSVTDTFGQFGADVVVDTRIDPLLPRNAIYARAAWEHLSLGLNRRDLDARGYVAAIGQSVVALRAVRQDADHPLPQYLKPLLGGMPNLRGFEVGVDAGDILVATSAELIVPLTSPLSIGKVGVSVFVDAGTVYDVGEQLSDQRLKQGYGGSLWFSAAFLKLNIAVAHGRGATTHVHVGANVSF
jgi:hypothetical protein